MALQFYNYLTISPHIDYYRAGFFGSVFFLCCVRRSYPLNPSIHQLINQSLFTHPPHHPRLIPPEAEILDLCTNWDSHLPNDVQYKFVEGHGMNEGELKANWRLDSSFTQDLNAYPYLPLQDQRFDAVLCCNGLQYLQQPRKVLQEVRRVLKPGGLFIVTFSSHMFPEKAMHVWLERSVIERVSLVVE